MVTITNDGPTILGAATTFTATLSFPNQTVDDTSPVRKIHPSDRTEYIYIWKQEVCGEPKTTEIRQNLACNFTQIYTCSEDVGEHTVQLHVDVRKEVHVFILKHIASNSTKFQITGKTFSGLEYHL